MSRRWWLMAATIVLTLGSAPASGGNGVTVAVFEGRGWGHGVGMAQDGALAMGLDGADVGTILGHFYPGTTLSRVGPGSVPVNVFEPGNGQVVLGLPHGGEMRTPNAYGAQHQGFPVKVAPGGSVVVRTERGGYRVEVLAGHVAAHSSTSDPVALPAGTSQTSDDPTGGSLAPDEDPPTADPSPEPSPRPPPPEEPPPDDQEPGDPPPAQPAGVWSPDPVWAVPADYGLVEVTARGRRYRGLMQITAVSGPYRAVNHVNLEDYLRGMGEVRDPSWPQAGLQAQAIAARTYALWYLGGHAELCDTQRCQVYLGQQTEYPAMDHAVASTEGTVLTHGGAVIQAVYSANAGGHLASEQEGFGRGAHELPYLRSARYPTRDPNPWTVEIALADVARRLGYHGELADIWPEAVGPSGRVIDLALRGSAGATTTDAVGGRQLLGLRSNLFTVRLEQRGSAPDAPPPIEDRLPVVPARPADSASEDHGAALGEGATALTWSESPTGDQLGAMPWIAGALGMIVLGAVVAIRSGRAPLSWAPAGRDHHGSGA